MAFGGVKINVLNGQLGQVPSLNDGICGLVLFKAGGDDTPKQIFSSADSTVAQVIDFYKQSGEGQELWVVETAQDSETAFGVDGVADKLMNASGGTIRIVGTDLVISNLATVQAWAERQTTLFRPVRVITTDTSFDGDVSAMIDLKDSTYNRVAVTLASVDGVYGAVGLLCGRLSAISVQEKISKVKLGDLGLTTAYLIDGTKTIDTEGISEALHDKGYIVFRKFANKNGFFFGGDHTATADTDDYSSLARGRVIDKAIILAYQTYLEEVDNDIELDASTGKLSNGVVKELEGLIENAINNTMTANAEISSVTASIDPNQNILSTNELRIGISILPKGYATNIIIDLGFTNPQS